MSEFSGKCDLYDHIGMEKMYDKGTYLVSDELECFEIFKQKTGGKIYQRYVCPVTKYNVQFIAEKCPEFSITENKHYKYYDKIYKTIKSLNKENGGVFLTREIHFDTLLDIIPYYPYLITTCGCSEEKETVFISEKSYVDIEAAENISYGYETNAQFYYKKNLQEHYLEVIKKYFCCGLEERTVIEAPISIEKSESGYIGTLSFNIDYMHNVEYIWEDDERKTHWDDPKFLSENKISIPTQDVEGFLAEDFKAGKIKIKYVKKVGAA